MDERETGMSLPTQTKLEEFQGKLYAKAKAEPAYRFYSLYDKIHRRDVLAEALRVAKANRGAPGVDGQSFEQIETYGEGRWLEELQAELESETYRAQPVRRVMIPKPGGGERPIGIPTIRDRVAQTAAKLILEPIFEADLRDEAYGYRPGRNAVQAVEEVHRELVDGKSHQVIDTDISKYFDTIPHPELMKCVARRIADGKVKMWLKVPVEEKDERGRPRLSGGKRSKQGTPQGGVISPLLANIYINRLLKAFARSDLGRKYQARIVNYADDFVVIVRWGAQQALSQLRLWLQAMKLTLNESKTRIVVAQKEAFGFLGYEVGPMTNRKTRRRYVGAQPSKTAMGRIRKKIRDALRRGQTGTWEEIVKALNSILTGWANYYSYGSPGQAFRRIDNHVTERVRHFLRKRHKLPVGTARFGYREVHEELGVVDLTRLLQLKVSRETCPGAGCGKSARPVR
jgi:RNA-directed DNA polymerase